MKPMLLSCSSVSKVASLLPLPLLRRHSLSLPKKAPMENDDKKTKSIFWADEHESQGGGGGGGNSFYFSADLYASACGGWVGGRAIKGRFSISDDFCKV